MSIRKLLWALLLCAQTAAAAAQPAQTAIPPVPSQREAPSTKPVLPSVENAAHTNEKQLIEADGNEYWPPIWGYKLKITDTFVALFTALLFFATVALWAATRGLVRSAENTARQQLRAYVGISSISLLIHPTSPDIHARIVYRNFGQTPAYKIACRAYLSWWPNPLEAPMGIRVSADLGLRDLMPTDENLSHPSLSLSGLQEPMEALRNESIAIYLLGEIVYHDAFGREFRDEITMMTTGQRAWSNDPFVFVDRSELTRAR